MRIVAFATPPLLAVIALGNACSGSPNSQATRPAPDLRTSSNQPIGAGRAGTANLAPPLSVLSGRMVRIPAGTFMMGALDVNHDADPVHPVKVSVFEMDATEVTVDAYRACVSALRCTEPGAEDYCNWARSDKGNHPINCVDWYQATAYCKAVGRRLPTEEEWEYGALGTSNKKYPWGEADPDVQLCWNRWETKQGTCEVGSYPGGDSPFGLHDMAGNVWEWTSSGYSEDYDERRDDGIRVDRGGAWDESNPVVLRGAFRYRAWPSHRSSNLGFRCAR